MQQPVDEQRAREFAGKLVATYTGAALTALIDIGSQTGLFDAAAKSPATSRELAERAGLQERYVREWLGAMTTGGIFSYDPASRTYTLPPEHAALLTGDTARNLAPMSHMLNVFGRNLSQLVRCFREGGGIPYSAFWPAFTEAMGQAWRRIYDEHLLSGFLPAAKGLPERLQAGIRVADIGSGAGHAINVMAREYPHSTFVGFDIDPHAVEKAAAEARDLGLVNARFEVCDVTQFPAAPPFQLIVAFDAIHDQVAPATVLRRVHDALAPDGTFLMIDFKFSSNLDLSVFLPTSLPPPAALGLPQCRPSLNGDENCNALHSCLKGFQSSSCLYSIAAPALQIFQITPVAGICTSGPSPSTLNLLSGSDWPKSRTAPKSTR